MSAPFVFGENDIYEHSSGDTSCSAGWCSSGVSGHPHPCEQEGCTGLVHANFFDEHWDGYSLETKCDSCGKSELCP